MLETPRARNGENIVGISVLRLGEHNGNKRVWITNKKLQTVFQAGEMANVSFLNKHIIIGKKPASAESKTIKISKRGNNTPIIDIKNKQVRETFGNIERVEVIYFADKIVIKIAKTEAKLQERKNKTGLKTFELFSGAGTLSSFFKKAGFDVKGSLELDNDYLAMFHSNFEDEEIYSISGRLEDVDESYYPKNIDVLLSGIPCTTYSQGNKKLKEAQKAKRENKGYDINEIKKEYEAEALTYHVLKAIEKMNPKTVVVEEVVQYSESPASMMLRTILEQQKYEITETIATGTNTKRKRWVLVANMGKKISLDNLLDEVEKNKSIEDLLDVPLESRDWKKAIDIPRIAKNVMPDKKSVGIRSVIPSDKMTNTFTKSSTRATEPILQKAEGVDLYSEFTNKEIARIHGLPESFKIDSRKTKAREVIGQGVTNMFEAVAMRILQSA